MNCCYQANFHSDNRWILGKHTLTVRKRKRKTTKIRKEPKGTVWTALHCYSVFALKASTVQMTQSRYSSRLVKMSWWEVWVRIYRVLRNSGHFRKEEAIGKEPKSMLTFLEPLPIPYTHRVRLWETGENKWMEPLEIFTSWLTSKKSLESDSHQIRSDRQVSQKSPKSQKMSPCRSIKSNSKWRDFTMGEKQKRFARANPQPSFSKISRESACNLAVALKETNVFARYQSPCNIHTMKRITWHTANKEM